MFLTKKKHIIHDNGVEQREKQFTTRIIIVSGKEDQWTITGPPRVGGTTPLQDWNA